MLFFIKSAFIRYKTTLSRKPFCLRACVFVLNVINVRNEHYNMPVALTGRSPAGLLVAGSALARQEMLDDCGKKRRSATIRVRPALPANRSAAAPPGLSHHPFPNPPLSDAGQTAGNSTRANQSTTPAASRWKKTSTIKITATRMANPTRGSLLSNSSTAAI